MVFQRLTAFALIGLTTATQVGAEAGGDPTRGEALFRQCSGCHQIGEGAENRIGPQLNHIFDRAAGAVEGFRYSNGLSRAAAVGLAWNYDTLDAFIENPRTLVSNTRMSFRGMPDQQDRDDLVAYLRVFSDSPMNIPEAAPTARAVDHAVAPEVLAVVGDPAYGEYLSGECTSCHQKSGASDGIPSITNWRAEDFVIAMHAYKDGVRAHPVMQMMAGRLSTEEIAALAAYFERIDQKV
ncbi:c-type cytochrome [Yoonia sp.]|uniref:c-type cytochrome n=1 Tax=Yoonia sp. TaxID=2212373 RepID=UPI0019D93E4A|nr:c-type cytochrome [Yoonia sp.]MBE0412724.1 c-type cytochrome [Yoonia sp.]